VEAVDGRGRFVEDDNGANAQVVKGDPRFAVERIPTRRRDFIVDCVDS
jgi:hypothetical protein